MAAIVSGLSARVARELAVTTMVGTAEMLTREYGIRTVAGNVVANVASGNGVLTVGGSGNTSITGSITKPGAGSFALRKIGAGTLTSMRNCKTLEVRFHALLNQVEIRQLEVVRA